MKRKYLIPVFFLFLLCLAACNAEKSKPSEAVFADEKNSVSGSMPSLSSEESAKIMIDVTKEVEAKNKNAVKSDYGEASMTAPFSSVEEVYDYASNVIRARVMTSGYRLNGPSVYTLSEIEILDVYKGNMKPGERIHVMELGGFVPQGVLKNAVAIEKTGKEAEKSEGDDVLLDVRLHGYKVLEEGEEAILFLARELDNRKPELYPEKTYSLVRVWQGKLLYSEETELYVPYIPKEELANVLPEQEKDLPYRISGTGTMENGIIPAVFSLSDFAAFCEGRDPAPGYFVSFGLYQSQRLPHDGEAAFRFISYTDGVRYFELGAEETNGETRKTEDFSVENGILSARFPENEDVYLFRITADDTLTFQQEGSSLLMLGGEKIVDGDVFGRVGGIAD